MENKVELLAPVGRKSVLQEVINAGADAVYLGGKRFNMRLLRPEFNFSDQELRDALALCHDQGVKLYVTLNNIFHDDELPALEEHLNFLVQIGVDAVIIQDLALAVIARSKGIHLHASVQMGVNNVDTVARLEQDGFRRVILSKNVTLEDIKVIKSRTGMALEYFVHGDLCIGHTGQCLLSGLMFGDSGNRGLCHKPCRWTYDLSGHASHLIFAGKHCLSHKDLCLYGHVPELIEAGITSFKIEGRMRNVDYLSILVTAYRQVIDRYYQGVSLPLNKDPDWEKINAQRVRDFSSGSLRGSTSLKDVDFTGFREPALSTGPRRGKVLAAEDYHSIEKLKSHSMALSVKTNSTDGLKAAIAKEVKTIILPGYLTNYPGSFQSLQEISDAIAEIISSGAEVVIDLPRIVMADDKKWLDAILELAHSHQVNAVAAHDPGTLSRVTSLGIKGWAGSGFNISNIIALKQVESWGAVKACPSLEMKGHDFISMAEMGHLPLEVLIHGPMDGIITDFCLLSANEGDDKSGCTARCQKDQFSLTDEIGQKYPLVFDNRCRCHIIYPLERSFFLQLPWFGRRIDSVRIDGEGYSQELLSRVIHIYQKALNDLEIGQWNRQDNYIGLIKLFPTGLTQEPLGSLEELN